MSDIERYEWICDDGCGRVDVRGSIEGPWLVCMNCGARVTKYVPAGQLAEAVAAERERVAAYVRSRASDNWDPSVEAALAQVAHEIERDHHHGGR